MAYFSDDVGHQLAAAIAHNWNADPATLKLINNRENAVFRVQLPDGRLGALRLHRPGYHSRAALASELWWISALADSGLPVPAPVAGTDGERLTSLPAGPEAGVIFADMLEWLDGTPLGQMREPLALTGDDRARVFHALGRVMARMHLASDALTLAPDFTRHAWDQDGLLGPQPFWGRFWECDTLSEADKELILAARDKAAGALTSYTEQGDYGLIHADLVRENVLVDGAQLNLIDFDDAGFGWRMFDVATALHKNRDEPDYPVLTDALVAGYQATRPLGEADLAQIDLFMVIRSFTYLGWIQSRQDEPGSAGRLDRIVKTAIADSQRYLG